MGERFKIVLLSERAKFQNVHANFFQVQAQRFAFNVENIFAERAFEGREGAAQSRPRARRVGVGIKERGEFVALVRGLRERKIRGEGDGFACVEREGTLVFFQSRRAEKMKGEHE